MQWNWLHKISGLRPEMETHHTASLHQSHPHSHCCHRTASREAGRSMCCWHRCAMAACRPATHSSPHQSCPRSRCPRRIPKPCWCTGLTRRRKAMLESAQSAKTNLAKWHDTRVLKQAFKVCICDSKNFLSSKRLAEQVRWHRMFTNIPTVWDGGSCHNMYNTVSVWEAINLNGIRILHLPPKKKSDGEFFFLKNGEIYIPSFLPKGDSKWKRRSKQMENWSDINLRKIENINLTL